MAAARVSGFESRGERTENRETNGLPDRLRQRLRSVDDEEAADARIEAAANEIIEERLRPPPALLSAAAQARRLGIEWPSAKPPGAAIASTALHSLPDSEG